LVALVSTHSFTEAGLGASFFAGFCPGKAAIGNSSAMPAAIDRYIAPPEPQTVQGVPRNCIFAAMERT
jgi:hypothetical protein